MTLYRRFPVKTTLYVEDICGPDQPDEFGLHSPRHTACFGAIIWLAEENYLRYEQAMQQEAFDEVVLSQACFNHFSSLAFEQNPAQTNISHLKYILENKSSDELDTFMHQAMKDFLRK